MKNQVISKHLNTFLWLSDEATPLALENHLSLKSQENLRILRLSEKLCIPMKMRASTDYIVTKIVAQGVQGLLNYIVKEFNFL